MTLVLVCECGARLRAPDAKPGRIGRCTACGVRLRVPDPLPELVQAGEGEIEVEVFASRRPEDASPQATRDAQRSTTDRGLGYGLVAGESSEAPPAPEVLPERAGLGASSRPRGEGRRRSRRAGGTTYRNSPSTTAAGRDEGGLIHPPATLETRFRTGLLYPLWDGPALAMLAFLTPICALLSVFSFGLRGYVMSGDEVMTMGALTMVFPMLCLLAVVFGYAGLFLGDVLESSARGELRHPKVPAWEFFEVFGSLGRWAVACGFGIAVGVGLARSYASASGALSAAEPRLVDEVLMAALLGLGAAFWPLPVVSVVLYCDFRAANPLTVLAALIRSPGGSIRIGLLFGLAGAATMALADLLFQLPRLGILAVLIGIPLFWLLFWYAAVVLCRRLGLFYRRHAKALGWFPDRPRWGAS